MVNEMEKLDAQEERMLKTFEWLEKNRREELKEVLSDVFDELTKTGEMARGPDGFLKYVGKPTAR